MNIYKVTITSSGETYYFTSLAAIYDTLAADDIGCSLSRLWHRKATRTAVTKTKKATIERLTVSRKAQKNKKTDNI